MSDTVTIPREAGPVTRPALRYHGGKWMLADWIIAHMPPHRVYVEPYGGGGSVMLSKEPSDLDVINDLDGDVINFFRVLRERPDELARAIELTPFALAELDLSYEPTDEPVERARRVYVRSWQGRGTSRGQWRVGWRRQTQSDKASALRDWQRPLDNLYAVAARLRQVQIDQDDAIRCILRYDRPDTLFYCDPPYPAETRGRWKTSAYQHEMTTEDHERLAETLMDIQGMALVSGYGCELYDRLYVDWRRVERDVPADGGDMRTEVLWISPRAARQHADDLPLWRVAV